MVITGEMIPVARLITLKAALKFEIEHGTNFRLFRGPLASTLLRREFGWKGNKVAIFARLCAEIEAALDKANQ
jgi:hypothetical protein